MPQSRVVDMPATTFHEMVSDPDVFVGGGSVAAVTGAAAGSTALLVMRLNARRSSLIQQRPAIERAIHETQRIITACEEAADEDIRILDDLLLAHRSERATGDRTGYTDALTAAAESTLHISELLEELLGVIDGQVELSSRFTVSDVGAAAVLAEGACRAALLTAEVNVALLLERAPADSTHVRSLGERLRDLHSRAAELGKDIEARTRIRLRGQRAREGAS